jgi:glycosyltransferase involved in cell wall biosynthesis
MSKSVLFLANRLAQGTGPFQRYELLRTTFKNDVYFWLNLNQSATLAKEEAKRLRSRNIGSIHGVNDYGLSNSLATTYKFCLSNQVDVIFAIHTRAIFIALLVSFLTCRRIKVVAFEGTLFSRYKKLQMYIRKLQNFMCDATICVAEHIRSSNSLANFGSSKRSVIYNGISVFKHDKDQETLKNNNLEFNIVFIGDLKPYKRPLDFINLVSKLEESGLNYKAHIFGGGPMMDEIKNLLANKPYFQNLTLHGHVDRKTIREFLVTHSGCGIISSELEGLSEVAVQFAYHGWPVICSNIPGNSEFFEHYGNYFDVGDVQTAFSIVTELLQNPDSFNFNINNMLKKVCSEFNINHIVVSYDEVFENVAKK